MGGQVDVLARLARPDHMGSGPLGGGGKLLLFTTLIREPRRVPIKVWMECVSCPHEHLRGSFCALFCYRHQYQPGTVVSIYL